MRVTVIDRKIWTALRTNKNAEYVVSLKKKIECHISRDGARVRAPQASYQRD